MARGVNKVTLIGHLGNDPDIRYATSGTAIANVSIATTDAWRDKETGDQKEQTEWHRVVFFGRMAEIVQEYLKKGSQVYVEGRLQTRKWQDKSGNDRYTTEIVANDMQMLGGRGGGGGGAAQGPAPTDSGGSAAPAPAKQEPAPSPDSNTGSDGFDDDVPF